MIDRSKAIALLGRGLAPGIVAGTLGCDPSYISQLLAEDDVALEVAKIRCAELEELTTRDKKYDSIEDRLLEKLENVLPFMLKPRDVLDAIKTINAAKRRGINPATSGIGEIGRAVVINLQLPAITLQQFALNDKNEVVQVGSRALVNIPAAALMKSLGDRGKILDAKLSDETPQSQVPRLSSKQVARAAISEDSV